VVDYLHVTLWLDGACPQRASDGDAKCANNFMLGEAAKVWLNGGTQRDGKSSVPPLNDSVTFLLSPARVGCCFGVKWDGNFVFQDSVEQQISPTEMIEFRANILGRRQQI